MTDFDWHGEKDRDSIVLEYQPPTAVYSSPNGNVVIRQKADETEEYDPTILLTPQGALAVAWRLIEEAHNVGLPMPSLSLMAESANWPPKSVQAEAPQAPQESDAGPLLKVMQGGKVG